MQITANGQVLTLSDGHLPQFYPVNTEATLPVNPSVGDTAIVITTGKAYQCVVAGLWNLTYSATVEEYSNHLGTVDNMQVLTVSGLGSGTTTAATHQIDLSTGDGAGTAIYDSNREVAVNTESFELNFIVKDLVSGSDGSRITNIGLYRTAGGHSIGFMQADAITGVGAWGCYTYNGTTFNLAAISNIVSGDRLTIKGYNNKIIYYVNGVVVATHTSVTFSTALKPTIYVSGDAGVTAARKISVDYLAWKIFK